MSVGPAPLFLLDTCIVVHLARADRTGKHIEQVYGLATRPDRPLISTVTEAEMLGLAYNRNWGQKRIADLRNLLAQFVRVDAGLPQVVEAYAELYAEMRRRGRPTGQNDLWIAASARTTGAVLMTSDTDFLWMHPNWINVVQIGPVP